MQELALGRLDQNENREVADQAAIQTLRENETPGSCWQSLASWPLAPLDPGKADKVTVLA